MNIRNSRSGVLTVALVSSLVSFSVLLAQDPPAQEAPPAQAQEPVARDQQTQEAQTQEVLAQQEAVAGNLQAGADKTAACAACHGPTGNESLLPNVPKIGGQNATYLLKQLKEIRDDIRVVPLMKPVVANLTDQDLADLAAHYATVELPLGAVDEAKRALGEKLYRAGDASIGVAACSACHSVDGRGIGSAGFPALSGQDVAYTELQLKLFRTGERNNDAAEIMRTITARLNDTEIAALASYVFGLR